MGNGESAMQKQLIELRLTSKQLARESKKCEKNMKLNQKKVKACIEKGDMEGARIFGTNAIRDKNQGMNYLKLSSRIEAVSQRVQTAISMGKLTKTMTKTVAGMDKTLKSMDIDKIGTVMDKFEENFETLDVRSAYMDQAMDQTTSGATPESEINELIQMVADEHGLELSQELDNAGIVSTKKPVAEKADAGVDLESRFAALNSAD